MSWYKIASNMTLERALQILGLSFGAGKDDIIKAYKQKAKIYHVQGGLPQNHEKMVELNEAYEFLKDLDYRTNKEINAYEFYNNWHSKQKKEAPWQTDPLDSNEVGKDFKDINFCKQKIYEQSIKNGPVEKWTVWAFDGYTFRGSFTVKTNEESFSYVGMVMEEWNSRGSNSYDTVAVFVSKPGQKWLTLIRENGNYMRGHSQYSFDSINDNPSNDPAFMERLRKKFEKNNVLK